MTRAKIDRGGTFCFFFFPNNETPESKAVRMPCSHFAVMLVCIRSTYYCCCRSGVCPSVCKSSSGYRKTACGWSRALATYSRKWLTHTAVVCETKVVSPYIGWLVAFHWVRVRVYLVPGKLFFSGHRLLKLEISSRFMPVLRG